AYYVQWHMEEAWAPLLFQDEFSEERNARRSPVRPPLRSEAAKWKDSTKRTLDGKPLHSFRTLLSDLGSISRVRVSPVGSGQAAFDILSEPTEDELEALRLLGVRLKP
ncbi:MAG: IS1634 family transposase, partial [Planctomycetota bacterium]